MNSVYPVEENKMRKEYKMEGLYSHWANMQRKLLPRIDLTFKAVKENAANNDQQIKWYINEALICINLSIAGI